MRILHTVESYYPSIGGMQEVVKQLSERLAASGHEVTVATRFHPDREEKIKNGVCIEQFQISGNAVSGYTASEEEIKRYESLLTDPSFQIITNFAAQQWATDIALPILNLIKAKKVFVPTGFSGLYLPQYKGYFDKMKAWMKLYDMNVFLSDAYRDIDFSRKNGIRKNTVIPNGAAADEFLGESRINIREKLGCEKDDFMILHLGSYTGMKGHKEALEIFLESEIKEGVLVMIGNDNDRFKRHLVSKGKLLPLYLLKLLKGRKVIITSLNREETVAAYKTADLFLFPSNIECSPIVLFECMASKLPFLTTDVGNTAEIIQWSSGGVLLPTIKSAEGYSHARIKDSALLLKQLYNNESRRKQLKESGFKAWQEHFSWEIIAKKYESLYLNLFTNGNNFIS